LFSPFIEEPTAWPQGRKFGGVAIAVENLTRRRRRKNNFGVGRKRFKPSTPGSSYTRCRAITDKDDSQHITGNIMNEQD